MPPLLTFAEAEWGESIALAVTGMLIVFVALGLVTLFLLLLPHIMTKLNAVFPEREHAHGHAPTASASKPQSDEDELIAAIGFALHIERSGRA